MNKERIIAQLKEYKKQKAHEFGIKKMGIFGSVAVETFKEDSDIDIVVELERRNLLNRIGLKLSLEKYLGAPVDVVTYRDDMNPLLKKRINRDVIYV